MFLCRRLKGSTDIPQELKELRAQTFTDLPSVCQHYRQFLIDEILQHGGHFSANLGTVELTIALHYVLNTPIDQLVWDVGHQAYLHKILTGRKDSFHTIRKKDGISGFPKPSESPFDVFGTGHSSTSISAVLGLAEADKLTNTSREHVAVIGDGSLTGGMSWEALNNAAQSNTNVLIIINDNQMGIDPNAGALNQYLNTLPSDNNFFTDLGFEFNQTTNGHDVMELVNTLQSIIPNNRPRVWHIKTVKGKGYEAAESEQTKWHAVKYVKIDEEDQPHPSDKYQTVFGKTLLELAQQNERIVGITPAMPSGSSMNILMEALPSRCFDVGIAEQHAVTFSAGLASNGLIPFCNIYSTFFQRAYDQVIHDVCLQQLPVIFCLDRAGVVGEDGPTHHGVFDLAFLRCIPNISIMVPANEVELRQMMFTATKFKSPTVIRYPKGYGNNMDWQVGFEEIPFGKSIVEQPGDDVCLFAIGPMVETALDAAQLLEKENITVCVVNGRFVKPLDTEMLETMFKQHQTILTLEDGCVSGGFGSAVLEYAATYGYKGHIELFGFPDSFIDHASREELLEMYGLDAQHVAQKVKQLIQLK